MASVTSMQDRFNTQHTSAIQLDLFGHSLLISQDPNSRHVGTTVWDASIVFAKFLEKNSNKRGAFNATRMAGKRAIELGAGCGVGGLAMALLGCNVVLTDQVEVLPLLLKNMERNVARIKLASSERALLGTVEACQLDWGNTLHIDAVEPPFDYIIGTDVVYADHLLEPLVTTILSLSGLQTTVVLAYEFRSPQLREALHSLCKQHFETKSVPRNKMDVNFQHPNIEILVMRRQKLRNLPMNS